MKYTCSIEVNVPRARFIELFDNPENLPKWQKGLQSFTPVSGTPGQVGAKSELVFLMGKRRVEMVETITRRALPNEFAGTYEAKGVWNSVANRFVDLGGRTGWELETEFRLGGFLKVLGWVMPGMFRKQSLAIMNGFKEFAETCG